VASAPLDAAPLLVWADELDSRGEALGEYVLLSYAQTKETDPARFVKTRARLEVLEGLHRHQWLLDAMVTETRWRWGLLRSAVVTAESEELFQTLMGATDGPGAHLGLLCDELRLLLRSPAGRFLEDLAVELPEQLTSVEPLFEVLRHHQTVRGVTLAAPNPGLHVRLDALPHLERWRVIGAPIDPGTTLPAGVRRLHLLRTPVFPGAEAWLTTPAPALEDLLLSELHVEVAQLLARWTLTTHPALRRLSLVDDLTDDVLVALAQSPLLKNLDALAVHGPFTDVGLDAVLRAAARFSRIASITLSGGAAGASLKRLAFKQLPQLQLTVNRASAPWTGW